MSNETQVQGQSAVATVLGKKPRAAVRPIDEAKLMEALTNKSPEATLSSFVTDFSKQYNINAGSLQQKLLSWKKELKESSTNTQNEEGIRTTASKLLKLLEFKNGRIGRVGGGRKKIDRVQSMQELLNKIGAKKSEDKGEVKQEAKPEIKMNDGQDVEVKVGQTTINIHTEAK